ncbi:MAG: SwmB domain-containing protein [bacterium]|nr:SwmB domain-containing protein [bacterium]
MLLAALLAASGLAALVLVLPAGHGPSVAQAQSDDVLVSNVGFHTAAATRTVGSNIHNVSFLRASAITTGGHPSGYELTSVTLALWALSAVEAPVPEVSIWSDSEGAPGEELFSLGSPPGFAGVTSTTARRYGFSAPAGTVLEPSTTYWVVVGASDFLMRVSWLETPGKTITSDPGWSHCHCDRSNTRRQGALGPTWSESAGSFSMSWHGQPVTTPPVGTLVSNLGQSPSASLSTGGSLTAYAASFTTPEDGAPNGYRLSSVTIPSESFNVDTARVELAIHDDRSGAPAADALIDLGSHTVPRSGSGYPRATFHAPATAAPLLADTTYWIVFRSGTDVNRGRGGWMRTNRSDLDAGSMSGWGIPRSILFHQNRWSTAFGQGTFLFNLQGAAIPPPPTQTEGAAVSNLAVGTSSGVTAATGPGGSRRVATSFTTGELADGAFEFDSLTLALSLHAQGTAEPVLRVSIHDDDSGSPGAERFSLDNPPDIGSIEHGSSRHFTFTSPTLRSLLPNTTYWVVVSATGRAVSVRTTTRTGEDPGAGPGWSIGDRVYWVTVIGTTESWFNAHGPFNLAVQATIEDLPHTVDTWGYVDEHRPSTGTLSASLDGDNPTGRNGDWWELRVTPGRRYRVEVEFTDPDAGLEPWEVGGGITIQGGCCRSYTNLWDHMSDDGRAFIEFTRHSLDQPYYLTVGPESSGEPDHDDPDPNARFVPNEYFGPYTITLTDITDVRLMVSNSAQESDDEQLVGRSSMTSANWLVSNSFTTGGNAAGYQLEFVSLRLSNPGLVVPIGVKAALHSDSSSQPGNKLFDFERIEHLTGAYSPRHPRFWAPPGTILTANTRYWIVFGDATTIAGAWYHLGLTGNADSENAGAASGWSIGDQLNRRNANSNSTIWDDTVTDQSLVLDVYASVPEAGGGGGGGGGGEPGKSDEADSQPPGYLSSEVDGAQLTIEFDEPLDKKSTPAASAFYVTVAGELAGPVTKVKISGATVTLVLPQAVTSLDSVTISYAAPADEKAKRLRDSAGNAVGSFWGHPVTNRTQGAEQPARNAPATGAPTITGTARVGETLTADTTGIDDSDGINADTIAYQWVAADGSTYADISGATSSTYTLVDADLGKTIKVRVSFTDDAGNSETLTAAATATVVAAVSGDAGDGETTSLTASAHDAPGDPHDGSTTFTFELRFSEHFSLSYRTLRDHAFTVTGGEVVKARRLEQGSNVRWEISVTPDGNGDVTIVLPATTDCEADGAICTGDGRMLSERLEIMVPGPGG